MVCYSCFTLRYWRLVENFTHDTTAKEKIDVDVQKSPTHQEIKRWELI